MAGAIGYPSSGIDEGIKRLITRLHKAPAWQGDRNNLHMLLTLCARQPDLRKDGIVRSAGVPSNMHIRRGQCDIATGALGEGILSQYAR
jgi:IS5 family transposase